MPRPIRFIFALHNHQPIGNFENVFEQSYQESYLPFLNVFEQYDTLKLALHTSGSLMEWLDAKHPEYVDRLAELVKSGRIEIIGGAFYEPILAMLPSRDRIGQIKKYKSWLENRIGGIVRGMWTPERVWEQSYVRDLAAAEIEYTILDDCHFRNASLDENQLSRHYLTEDDGSTMSIFPGSERLRYLIPFGNIDETIRYFAEYADTFENAVLVHGDDGEKFGTWPNTYHHVYNEYWLHHFFDALRDNSDWLVTTTPSEILDTMKPLGKIYLPDGSYREMTEWATPPERQNELADLQKEMTRDPKLSTLKKYIRGGFWRNFKIRYPETNDMYSRMMATSLRLKEVLDEEQSAHGNNISESQTLLRQDSQHAQKIEAALDALYRGQCNCSYWHGAFGGVYLPHLRNAVYHHLIQADNLIDEISGYDDSYLEADVRDFNFDGHKEIRIANNELLAWFAPNQGGTMYELDVREICHNLGATLARRNEAYHRTVLDGGKNNGHGNDCASIHDRVVFKQEGLDSRLQYDSYPRKCFVDLFYDCDTNFDDVRNGRQRLHSTLHQSEYHATLYRTESQAQLILKTEGLVYGVPVKVQKTVTMTANSPALRVLYQLSGMPREYRFHFATELNFAGLPGGAEDRYFSDTDDNRLGHLGTPLNLKHAKHLRMTDEWLGIDVSLDTLTPSDFYAFPVETVSQSEGGFELVQQSIALQPHWIITPDKRGCWSTELTLTLDTSRAKLRRNPNPHTSTEIMNDRNTTLNLPLTPTLTASALHESRMDFSETLSVPETLREKRITAEAEK
ncbi:MAG: DUF1926 domain-containing protein [Planctomycetaceae bacterium]|jgi:alpha-amylase|nr:DUF1926 domain-containing protein [Planctomycetaceae bacterium]